MSLFGYHRHHLDDPLKWASPAEIELYYMMAHLIKMQEQNHMATKAQIDKLMADVEALIAAGVAEITAAVAAAQSASNDPAIDTLDTAVTNATDQLTAAAAALQPPPASGGTGATGA